MTRKKKTKSISGTLRALSKTTQKAGESRAKETRKQKPRQKSLYDKHLESEPSSAKAKAKSAPRTAADTSKQKIASGKKITPGQTGAAKKRSNKPGQEMSRKPTPATSTKDKRKPIVKPNKPETPELNQPPLIEPQLNEDVEINMDEMSGEELFDLFDKGSFKH